MAEEFKGPCDFPAIEQGVGGKRERKWTGVVQAQTQDKGKGLVNGGKLARIFLVEKQLGN